MDGKESLEPSMLLVWKWLPFHLLPAHQLKIWRAKCFSLI